MMSRHSVAAVLKSNHWIGRGDMRAEWRSLVLFGCLGAAACESSGQRRSDDQTGSIALAVSAAPAGVGCLNVTVAGSTRTVTRSLDVTPGVAIDATLSGLPTGAVAVTANAFADACAVVGATSIATWNSDPIMVTLASGVATPIQLVMRQNGLIDLSVDWDTTGAGGAAGGAGGATGGAGGATVDAGAGGTAGSGGTTDAGVVTMTCPTTIAGVLDTTDSVQIGRESRISPVAVCGVPKPFPSSVADPTNPHLFDVYHFVNPGSADACFNFTLTYDGSTGVQRYLAAYTHFDPTNIGNGYLGDVGGVITSPQTMGITVPAASSIDVVVLAIDPSPSGVGPYTLSCASP
jgi:hypothetical protein